VQSKTFQRAFYFYVQDVWRPRPDTSLSYALSYGWQSAPTGSNGQSETPTYTATGKPVDPDRYPAYLLSAAQQGQFYTLQIGYEPYKKAGLSCLWNTDYSNLAPKLALAWNPSVSNGFLSSLMDRQKTLVRGGFGTFYDRTTSRLIRFDTLADGYSQIETLATPRKPAVQIGYPSDRDYI
jgi:hypothetical protein